MRRLSKILLGLFIVSTLLMGQDAEVDAKLKVIQTVVINGVYSDTGIGRSGTKSLDFANYNPEDRSSLEARSTIYFSNVNLKDNTLDVKIPPTFNLKSGNNTVAVALDIDKDSSDSNSEKITSVDLHGVISPTAGIKEVGEYKGTLPVTIGLN